MHYLSRKRISKREEIRDFKVKIIIFILFIIITCLITYSYVIYHAKIVKGFHFQGAKLSKSERFLKIFNDENEEILFVKLGVNQSINKKPFDCKNNHSNSALCLEWDECAKLIIEYERKSSVNCYIIKWIPLSESFKPTDCFHLAKNNGIWFGGSKTKSSNWYLNRQNFGFQPLISGDAKVYEFGNGIKRYFINSLGIAIKIDNKTPLHVSINESSNNLCFRATYDDFAFVTKINPFPELFYKICSSSDDIKNLHRIMTQKNLWKNLKEQDLKVLHSVIEEPIWQIPAKYSTNGLTESIIYNYSESIIQMGYMKLGHILVNEFWQQKIGDFTVHQSRFQNLKNIIDILHRRGFKIVFTVQPFVSTESANFKFLLQNKLLIYERNGKKMVPALTRYKSTLSAGVLDITNNETVVWILQKLKQIKENYRVDYFYLDLGIAYNLPYYYQCEKTLVSPDIYFELFATNLEHIGIIGISTASFTPKPPSFLSIPLLNSSWESLQEVMTYVLVYGIIGFPFIIPASVGGDYVLSSSKKANIYLLEESTLPAQELYIRWLQLTVFLPVVQFMYLPSEYKNKTINNISKELTVIRQKTVIPLLKKYSIESINEGTPLIRPLWMLDTNDLACINVNDEFSIGEELIVAPILKQGHTFREGKVFVH